MNSPALFLFATLAPLVARAENDSEKTIRQLREFYGAGRPGFAMRDTNEAIPDQTRAQADLLALAADGSWPDIEYKSEARSSWPAAKHANRMAGMAGLAARSTGATRDALHEGVHRAFSHWIKHDPKCPNWWYNEIGVPKNFAITALLMGDALKPEERNWLLRTMAPRARIAKTGQNRIWLAGNTLMFALLAHDEELVDKAAATIRDEVKVTTDEGVQPDFSFHQHGAQQQNGNYGLAFAVEISRWAGVLRDTKRALKDDELAVLRNFLLTGLAPTIRNGAMDIGSCGRQFMPGTPKGKARAIADAMGEAAMVDRDYAPQYRAFIARNLPGAPNDLTGFSYYWRSDYAVHRLKNFSVTLKMSSARVIGAETTNNENMSGYHIADGMLLSYATGAGYDDIFPVWDWRRLPGVTAPQSPLPKFHTTQVKTDFTGGLSDGETGVAALDYAKDGVFAHKAWFFTPRGVVALGAGIASELAAPVVTGVEQTRADSPVERVGEAIEHAGLRYTPLGDTKFVVKTGVVSGNWKRIYDNPSTPKADVSLEVFALAADHGVSPSGARYAYAIGAAGDDTPAGAFTNTPAVQVVKIDDAKTGFVFWKAGEAEGLSVDHPCLVIHDARANVFRVADPTQKLKSLAITCAGKTYEVALPTGARAGGTVTVSR